MSELEPQPINEEHTSSREIEQTIEDLEEEAARHRMAHDTRGQAVVEHQIYLLKRQREMQGQVH